MTTLEELKRELRDKKAELRKYKIELNNRNEAFEKRLNELSPKFEVKYDVDLYGVLFDTTDHNLDYRYAEACEKIMDVEGVTKKFFNARTKLVLLVRDYNDLMDGPLPKKIERVEKEIADLENEIKEMINARS